MNASCTLLEWNHQVLEHILKSDQLTAASEDVEAPAGEFPGLRGI